MYYCANSQKIGKINLIVQGCSKNRQGCSKDHVVSTKFKYPLCPLQEKGRRIPIHIQEKVYEEIKKLLKEGHIKRLDKCTSDCFIAPIVITVKEDDSIKLALDAKPIN